MASTDLPIAYWTGIERPDGDKFMGTDELRSLDASFGERFGLQRLGIHHVRVPPGRRTSFPHAKAPRKNSSTFWKGSRTSGSTAGCIG